MSVAVYRHLLSTLIHDEEDVVSRADLCDQILQMLQEEEELKDSIDITMTDDESEDSDDGSDLEGFIVSDASDSDYEPSEDEAEETDESETESETESDESEYETIEEVEMEIEIEEGNDDGLYLRHKGVTIMVE